MISLMLYILLKSIHHVKVSYQILTLIFFSERRLCSHTLWCSKVPVWL